MHTSNLPVHTLHPSPVQITQLKPINPASTIRHNQYYRLQVCNQRYITKLSLRLYLCVLVASPAYANLESLPVWALLYSTALPLCSSHNHRPSYCLWSKYRCLHWPFPDSFCSTWDLCSRISSILPVQGDSLDYDTYSIGPLNTHTCDIEQQCLVVRHSILWSLSRQRRNSFP